jgi:dihydropteroate synthase
MIGAILGGAGQPVPPEGRLFGTLAAHMAAYEGGAMMLRVHDVAEHQEMIRVLEAIKGTPDSAEK